MVACSTQKKNSKEVTDYFTKARARNASSAIPTRAWPTKLANKINGYKWVAQGDPTPFMLIAIIGAEDLFSSGTCALGSVLSAWKS